MADPQGSRQAVDNINTLLGSRAGVLDDVLRLVFRMIPLRDLKTVSLVCQLWREAAEQLLWTGRGLRVTRRNMSGVAEALADSNRLQGVRNLRLVVNVDSRVCPSEELLKAVARHRGLRSIDMGWSDLSAVDPELLARALEGLEEVNMLRSGLTQAWPGLGGKEKANAVLTAVCAGGSRLKTLNLEKNNLSMVKKGLLASAVNSLVEVNLSQTDLTTKQTIEILTAVCVGGSRLKSLDISVNVYCLKEVDGGLLARVVNSLEHFNINNTSPSQQQAAEIFTAIGAGGSRLKTLKIAGISHTEKLSSVEKGLLARAVKSLEEVHLGYRQLTPNQLGAIFTAISEIDSKLRHLDIQHNYLPSVEPNILAKAVNSLKEVNLADTELNQEQLEAVFSVIGEGDSQLKHLVIQPNNLSRVEPNILARAVTSLRNVNLANTQLTKHQLEAIFTNLCFATSRLKILNLHSTPAMRLVEEKLVARAVNCLEMVAFSNTQLSKKKIKAIHTQGLVKSSLRKLTII